MMRSEVLENAQVSQRAHIVRVEQRGARTDKLEHRCNGHSDSGLPTTGARHDHFHFVHAFALELEAIDQADVIGCVRGGGMIFEQNSDAHDFRFLLRVLGDQQNLMARRSASVIPQQPYASRKIEITVSLCFRSFSEEP